MAGNQALLAKAIGISPPSVAKMKVAIDKKGAIPRSRDRLLLFILKAKIEAGELIEAPSPDAPEQMEVHESPEYRERRRFTKAIDQVIALFEATEAQGQAWRDMDEALDKVSPVGPNYWKEVYEEGRDWAAEDILLRYYKEKVGELATHLRAAEEAAKLGKGKPAGEG